MAFGGLIDGRPARSPAAAMGGVLQAWRYPLALLLGVLIAGAFVLAVTPTAYVYRDPDSSFYLEAARNLLDGKGLTVSAGLEKLPATTEPLALWPPGYPLLIVLGSALTGVDPLWIAPALSWASWALMPAALMFALQGLLTTRSSFAVATLAMIAPGAIDFAWQPMTDLPFLLLTILSFGLLVRGASGTPGLRLVLLAGLVAGLAYAVRNAGVALVPAVVGAYAAMVLFRLTSWRRAIRTLVAWGTGFALILAPLQVRNLLVFGGVQPYQMDPSTLGVLANLRYLAAAALNDVVAVHGLMDAVVWRDGVLLLAGLACAALLWRLRGRPLAAWRELPGGSRETVILLGSYAAAAAAVLVAARSRYEWGEFIGLRHLLQLDWILLAAAAVALERGPPLRRTGVAVTLALIATLLIFRVSYLAAELQMARREGEVATAPSLAGFARIDSDYRHRLAVKLTLARDEQLLSAIGGLPFATILVSNYDDVVRVRTGRVVQPAVLGADCDLRGALRLADGAAPPPAVLVLLFPRRELLASGCWERLGHADRTPGGPAWDRPYLIALDAEELGRVLTSGR